MNISRFIAVMLVNIGQRTILGRGKSKKLLVKLMRMMRVNNIVTLYKGVPYEFNLDNTTEAQAIFGRYNEIELSFLVRSMPKDGVFIDIGANSGLYTQYLTAKSPSPSTIVAIEPNPKMIVRLKRNLELLKEKNIGLDNVVIIEMCAAGKTVGTTNLGLESGFGMAHIIPDPTKNSIEVPMMPLMQIVERHGIRSIDCLKIDIEGYEDVVLVEFFSNAPTTIYPKSIVIEYTSQTEWHTNILSILERLGYQEIGRTRSNCLLRLSG